MKEADVKLSRACRFVGKRNELIKQLEKEGKLISPRYYCHAKGGYCADDSVCVALVSRAHLPTRFGEFDIAIFENSRDAEEHLAITRGDLVNATEVPVRVHSQCQTGDIFGSLRCDCRDQLEQALKTFGQQDRAVLLYLKQEGRGIGLANKIRAYHLQEQGLDTVEANEALGFRDDLRTYEIAAAMLRLLQVQSIVLYTNNPQKITGLEENGIPIVRREPIVMPANPFNVDYLKTKKKKAGHWLD
ncbi:MAG: GTP cyclohydrolase II [candidate division KSB1 bacterium]|nr:GTP cyclohydrolase II [candidate division KSB1 bacterium]MDZ7319619.1 GTP cyclohydrolase II [candidate division KSB1 bacterium]MDZ7340415.1 GTP cyclohydrolase II [candidate division KSB1 bacterium]